MLEAAAHLTRSSNQMLRKIIIGLVTAASLSAMALVPTEASARSLGGHGFGRGGGFGGHGHFGGLGLGRGLGLGLGLGLAAAIVDSGCRSVVTANGRVVNVCF
jgi:hypothetical protein